MGIERFFSSIEENKITTLQTGFTKTLASKLDATYFLIDFNSIVYITSYKVLSDLNYMIYKIITKKMDREKNKKIDTILKDYNLDLDESITPDKFNKIFTEDKLSSIIIDKVLLYVVNALTNYINPDKLKFLYIAIDGVPSKSKMLEQKKRRYMGAFAYEYKERIFNKYEDELKKDHNRYTYEKNKIGWKTHNITPGTKFMDDLNSELSSTKFKNILKKNCKNIETYIFSGPYEPGEGENKIVNQLRSMKQEQNNYLVYSPDSDVTLLCLLLNCSISPKDGRRVSYLSILRHNQQKNNYDVVDIDRLSSNLYVYVNNNIGHSVSPNRDAVINDIVFLLTIFGNDFLPKIESFTIKYDFDRIIDKYINVLKSSFTDDKYNHIIDYSEKDNKKIIDQYMLTKIFKKLQVDEGGHLQKVYMSTHYQNYNKLRKIMGADQENFTQILNEFLSKLRNFNNEVRKIDEASIGQMVDKWTKEKEKDFMDKLKRLTGLPGLRGKNITGIKDEDFIISYIEHYKRDKKLPQVRVTFRKFSRSLQDNYHRSNLEKILDHVDPNLKITSYDEEVYKFEYMLDEYVKKLNSKSLDIGYMSIDPKTYTFKSEKILKGIKRYYEEFFGIEDISGQKMVDVAQTYINGLVWVFEYYFNRHDIEYHHQNADIAFYPYTHAPLLKQIYDTLKTSKKGYLTSISNRLEKIKVDRKIFFNSLEQMMYVTPVQIYQDVLPDEYKNFVKTSGYYPKLDNVVNEIWASVRSDEIDCRGVIFLNKCHLKINKDIQDFEDDQKFIQQLRKIKLRPETAKRQGVYIEGEPNVTIFLYK